MTGLLGWWVALEVFRSAKGRLILRQAQDDGGFGLVGGFGGLSFGQGCLILRQAQDDGVFKWRGERRRRRLPRSACACGRGARGRCPESGPPHPCWRRFR